MFVSVVIPSRNDGEMLARCLASLANQRRVPDEIVVVDNGSTDDTRSIAEGGGARVVWEPIPGIPRASAVGFDAAKGDLIARVDADSVCPPEWLERVVAAFENDPALDLISGSGEFYDAGPITRRLGKSWWIGGLYWSMTIYLSHPPIFGSNFAMRRAVWTEIGPEIHREERNIHDDLDLSLHIKPWMHVRYDRDLVVGISARPFSNWSGFIRRLSWVIPTLRNHWPEDSPWARRAARRKFESARRETAARDVPPTPRVIPPN